MSDKQSGIRTSSHTNTVYRYIVTVALLTMLGCGRDYAAGIDSKVSEQWMRPGMYVDAVEYLESGGRYSTTSLDGQLDLDREAIVPLLKRLNQKFAQDQYAILLEDENYCWGIVVRLPEDELERERIAAFLEKEEQSFPGMILTEWGHEWLSLDFLDEQAAALMREAEAAAEAAS